MVLRTLYNNILNIEFNLFGWARTLCKYGDFFLYLDIDDKEGVKFAVGLPPNEVERLEGEDKTNPNYVQFQWNSGGITFENWQIAHFRILGNDKYAPYGSSALEPARRIWRQLTLLEDAMMAYRIVRSPERRVFYIDIGNIAPEDTEAYIQKIVNETKRHQVVDHETGRVDLRYNPMSIEEDFYIPVRGDQSSRVESLPGGQYTGDIDDVKYLKDKLFAALKVPQSYLFRGEGAEEDKTTLAQKDVRFARTIQRIQKSLISELEKVGIIHLFTLGFRGDDLINFKLSLNNPSKLAELQELEQWRTKFDVASAASEGFFSRHWIAKNLFGLTEEQFLRMQRETFYDKKFDIALEKVAEQIESEEMGGGMGGGAGGMGMDDIGYGDEELSIADEEGGADLEAPAEDEGEDDSMLLASPDEAPGKRDHKVRYKDGSTHNGVSPEQRRRAAVTSGKTRAGKSAARFGTNTRNTRDLGSIFKGYEDMRRLTRGVSEQMKSIYEKEEKLLIEVKQEQKAIDRLIESLENKNEDEA
jgi:hypothetical protein